MNSDSEMNHRFGEIRVKAVLFPAAVCSTKSPRYRLMTKQDVEVGGDCESGIADSVFQLIKDWLADTNQLLPYAK